MKRLHIIGRKNHGKTQLLVELTIELRRRGWRVGTIKHTHHRHELDTPGKDSHRHREAGAAVVGIMSQGMNAVFLPAEHQPKHADRYSAMSPLFADCDLVLVEGDSQTNAPKIEVWRAELSTPPIALEDRGVLAIVTDDTPLGDCNILQRSCLTMLTDWIEKRFLLRGARARSDI